MDAAVHRARCRMLVGVDPDHDLVREHFDPLHYLLQAPDLLNDPDVDLVEHFLTVGQERGLSPHPDFSAAEYRRRHPRKAGSSAERSPYLVWLKRGRAAGDVADPAPRLGRLARVLGREPHEVAEIVRGRRDDLNRRLRTGELGEMFAAATELEPLIGDAWQEAARPRLLPLSHAVVVDELFVLHQAQEAAGFGRARLVIVINRGRWGGGRRMEGHVAHAVSRWIAPEEIVVIHTDESTETPSGRYPPGVRVVDFAATASDLPAEAARHALVVLLRSFRADAILNVNSRMLHQAMRTHGRAMAVSERVFPVFFCNEQTGMGTWRGWSLRYFYRTFGQVAGVITDSEHLRDELADRHRATSTERARMHVLKAPVDPGIDLVPAPRHEAGERPQVFWAGRWDRQKRVDLFLDVARAMPDVDFRMWGESVLGGHGHDLPDNVVLQGRYGHFSELPLEEADLWLYTSGWDGVPSLLLEVAMTGVPIVGTSVGGTGEVIRPGLAWPVAQDAGADAYVDAARQVLATPHESRQRAAELREHLLRERSPDGFAESVKQLLLCDDGDREAGR
jgi:glycosyltransferase involved in cell wall biosynthesis